MENSKYKKVVIDLLMEAFESQVRFNNDLSKILVERNDKINKLLEATTGLLEELKK